MQHMEVTPDVPFYADFEHAYGCEVIFEMPSGMEPLRFPSDDAPGDGGMLVRFSPPNMAPWVGQFPPGLIDRAGLYCVASTPSKNHCCVVSNGCATLLDVRDASSAQTLPTCPTKELHQFASFGLLVVSDYCYLYAYGPLGLAWESGRVAMDGLRVDGIRNDCIAIRSYDYQSEDGVVSLVDPRTGEIVSG